MDNELVDCSRGFLLAAIDLLQDWERIAPHLYLLFTRGEKRLRGHGQISRERSAHGWCGLSVRSTRAGRSPAASAFVIFGNLICKTVLLL